MNSGAKRSAAAPLVLISAIGLTACSSRSDQATMTWDPTKPRDPCADQHFEENYCKDAVRRGGYYYGGHWIGTNYSQPYGYYYNSHSNHLARGGSYNATPVEVYSPKFRGPSPGTTVRGGFGSTGRSASSASASS